MKTRKIILLSAIVVLLVVFICQLVFNGQSSIKDVTLDSEIDTILIQSATSSVTLTSTDGVWYVGDEKYLTDTSKADKLVSAVKDIRVLQTVSNSSDDDRYGLGDGEVITVTASKDGKTLRTISIGKAAVTSSQTYAQLDGKNEVLLVSGTLRDTFNATVDSLRDTVVFKVDDVQKISRLDATNETGSFSLVKTVEGDTPVWTLDSPLTSALDDAAEIVLDAEKAASWATSFSVLHASGFTDSLGSAVKCGELSITTDADTINLTVYKVAATSEDAEDIWYCKNAQSPYIYQISQYSASNILKSLSGLQ